MVVEDAEPVGIGLADAINQVRTELERAIKDGENNSIAFRAGTVELEFQVAFAKSAGVKGGLQLSVFPSGHQETVRQLRLTV
jgi:hypothetical protein